MYYASLADNIAEADGHMSAALGIQKALIATLASDVHEPFATTMPNFQSLISTATGLKDVNASTLEAQSSFTKSVADLLTGSSVALSGQLPAVDEYADRQREIAQLNADNSNRGIADQAESDRDFYGAQFDVFRTGTLCTLSGLDASDAPAPCADPEGVVPPHLQSRVAELRQAITQFSEDHALAVKAVFDDLDGSIGTLRAIELLLSPPAEPTVPGEPPLPAPPAPPAPPAAPVAPEIFQSLHDEIQALEATRDSLDHSGVPSPLFEPELTNLDAWYAAALDFVKTAALTPGTVNSLEIHDWKAYSPDGTAVYIDTSDDLHNNITAFIAQSAETSSRLATSSTAVPDNSSLFDALLQNSTTTSTGAEKVRNGVDKLLSTGNTGLAENQAYYANFATVLANTRTPGVDTGNIYSFFSAPIDAKNVTPELPSVASVAADATSALDPKWLIVFAGGLLVGGSLMAVGGAIRRRKRA